MNRITVYHKPNCVQCNGTRRRLEAKGLAFDEVDLTTDPAALLRATSAGHREAPIIALDGKIAWSGFRPDLIDALARDGSA